MHSLFFHNFCILSESFCVCNLELNILIVKFSIIIDYQIVLFINQHRIVFYSRNCYYAIIITYSFIDYLMSLTITK
ncbi:hypothetical protein E2565_07225 [Ligilactobacillus salivarius]|nr:hypothetical protein E2565_07225 [Ligilactobacillus salivarius]